MKYLIIVTGPTGVGKTKLSIDLAQHFSTEILSCDSRQIYREMKIGTAVPSPQELSSAKHHFIGTVSIHDYYNVSQYEHEALTLIEKLHRENDIVILTGGTGLYIEAICKGIDLMPDPEPQIREELNQRFEDKGIESLQKELKFLDLEYYQKVDLKNPARLIRALEVCKQTGKTYSSFRKTQDKERPFRTLKIALNMDREELYGRINRRVDVMAEEGLLEEAKSLYKYKALTALKTVGYSELFGALDGQYSLKEGLERIKNSSRRYARKQISWIRRDSSYQWFHPSKVSEIIEYIDQELQNKKTI